MTRTVPVTVLLVVLAAGRVARADDTLPAGATLAFDKLYIQQNGGEFQVPTTPNDRLYYFNRAHCTCSKAKRGKETEFKYVLTLTGGVPVTRPAEFWVGTSCDVEANRIGTSATCRNLPGTSIAEIGKIAETETAVTVSIYDVIAGANTSATTCPADETDKLLWLLADLDADAKLGYSLSKNVGQPPGETAPGIDTNPPPPPENLTASSSEGAILLSWATPTSRAQDLAYYQALCAKPDGSPVRTTPPGARYVTTAKLCGLADEPAYINRSTDTTVGDGETAIASLPSGLATLDPAYICGESSTGSATSLRVDGLENEVPYTVMVVATDLHGNFAAVYAASTVTPHPVTDFWEDLHDHGSQAEGGLCLLAETYGDDSGLTQALRAFRDDTLGGSRAGRWLGRAYYATLGKLGAYVHGSIALRIAAGVALAPLVALALAWHWLTLPGLLAAIGLVALARRRRAWLRGALAQVRPAHIAATLAVATLTLAQGQARAGGHQPYWEDNQLAEDDRQASDDDSELVKWHAGVRVGPYRPGIDKQLGISPGPYERMFGTAPAIMPVLDVDRILWTGFGQLGIGGSIGYTQRTADAFQVKTKADEADVRVGGASTHFRLLPLALTASYRFTWLDETYGIPIVPYVRGGLSYYVWWSTAPDGSISRVCKPGATDPACDKSNKAFGASAGVQGSIGLAIRAERIDADTAQSMRQSGIQHAGIYGELSVANVNGFGSDSKLSVGDRTWFAGVDFEF